MLIFGSLKRRDFYIMNNGNKRREKHRNVSSKKYKVRYDRIVAAVLVLAVIIVVLTSCIKSISGSKKKSNESKSSQTSTEASTDNPTIIDNLTTSDQTSSILSSSTNESTTVSSFSSEVHPAEDVNRGDLILVNSDHEYKFPEQDTEPLTLYDHINTDHYQYKDWIIKLDSNVIDHLNSLMEAFYKETSNKNINIIEGYRTLEEQNNRYYSGDSPFMGGFSDYHTARSFDMGIFPEDGSSAGYYSPIDVYAFIDEHSAEYGFIVRFPEGKENLTGIQARTQTYRYVGVPHAAYIKENNLCLEEYIAKIKEYNNTAPLEIKTSEKIYNVYFVPANTSGDTDVPVPTDKSYTVSGNNVDGFIVTVEMN